MRVSTPYPTNIIFDIHTSLLEEVNASSLGIQRLLCYTAMYEVRKMSPNKRPARAKTLLLENNPSSSWKRSPFLAPHMDTAISTCSERYYHSPSNSTQQHSRNSNC